MDEGIGAYRAALLLGRRRTLIGLLATAMALLSVLAWSSYRNLDTERRFLHQLQAGNIGPGAFSHFGGLTCEGGGPEASGGAPVPVPSEQSTCRFVTSSGQPIGPIFHGDPLAVGGLSQEQLQGLLPQLIEAQKQNVFATERVLGTRTIFASRVSMLGTLIGIVFAVLLGATFFGAESRWGVWKTLLTHEPRRRRVLVGKFVALWTLILTGFVSVLAVVSVVDVMMHILSHVHASGGPSIARLASQSGWALLSLETYATISAALVIVAGVTLAGMFSLLMILGDHLLVTKYRWLRHYFPVQQVGVLLSRPNTVATGYAWPSPVTGGVVCPSSSATGQAAQNIFNACSEIVFKPIPHWRASIVLVVWAVAFALIAWSVLRARDVPQ